MHRKNKPSILVANASPNLWHDKTVCRLWSFDWILEELYIKKLLAPNIKLLLWIGTPKYLIVRWRSMICSMHVQAAANSELHVAVSNVVCFYQTSQFNTCNRPAWYNVMEENLHQHAGIVPQAYPITQRYQLESPHELLHRLCSPSHIHKQGDQKNLVHLF